MSRKAQHITLLHAENFKRLKAVNITPDGRVVKITGPNEAGKSTVLDAIEYALGGGNTFRDIKKPINKDAKEAVEAGDASCRIIIETEDYRVTRHWTNDETSYLKVETIDGAKFTNAQQVLDKMISKISFDPLEFSRMEPKKQAEAMLGVLGIKEEILRIDADQKRTFDERTATNRLVKELTAELAACPVPPEDFDPEAPAEDLITQITEINNVNSQRQTAQNRINDVDRDIAETEQRLTALKTKKKELEDWLEANPERDAEEAARMKQKHEDRARLVDIHRRYTEAKTKLDRNTEKAASQTKEIDGYKAAKAKILADSKAASIVPGLGFEEDGVTIDGLPFNQLSQGQKIKIGFSVLRALNPELRVICIRDGSLLDENNMKLVGELCEENDFQAFVEIATVGEGLGIYIEDGSIKA